MVRVNQGPALLRNYHVKFHVIRIKGKYHMKIGPWKHKLVWFRINTFNIYRRIYFQVSEQQHIINPEHIYKWFMSFIATIKKLWRAIAALIKMINVNIPDSKVHGANMGPIWGQQDSCGPHVGPMNFVIWDFMFVSKSRKRGISLFSYNFRDGKYHYFSGDRDLPRLTVFVIWLKETRGTLFSYFPLNGLNAFLTR